MQWRFTSNNCRATGGKYKNLTAVGEGVFTSRFESRTERRVLPPWEEDLDAVEDLGWIPG